MKNKGMAVILILAICFGNVFCHIPVSAEETMRVGSGYGVSPEAGYGLNNPTFHDEVVTWDCVWFGNYWQKDTNGNGTANKNDAKQPIKWRVLWVDGDDAFLLADQSLDCQKYNDADGSVTWETCTIRSWLNGYGAEANKEGIDYSSNNFFDDAFTAAEQSVIETTEVENPDNTQYSTQGGNNTIDQVYLLSIDEVNNPDYGFLFRYNEYSGSKRAKNTEYAKSQGAFTNYAGAYPGIGVWWLRSPGSYKYYASFVDQFGRVMRDGDYVDTSNNAVRPVLHLNLKASPDAMSAPAWSYAGTVTSEGETVEVGPPMSTPKPTATPTAKPTVAPTATPTLEPTVPPTSEPTEAPTTEPTTEPTLKPTVPPTSEPTEEPTTEPTVPPTSEPTEEPTSEPTVSPTSEPTEKPTTEPTVSPTSKPTIPPTALPTEAPTDKPAATPGATTPNVSEPRSQTPTPILQPEASPAPGVGKAVLIRLKQKKRMVTASWKKVTGADGYQICYSTSKSWKSKKQKLIRKNEATVKNLKKKKVYYFRVRAYRLEGTRKVYGAWSKTKKIRMKK